MVLNTYVFIHIYTCKNITGITGLWAQQSCDSTVNMIELDW